MAPKPVLVQNRNKSNNNTFIKKLNRCLLINNNLQKRIEKLSDKNKELSRTRNSMLLEKLALQNENNSIKNVNTQLTAKKNIMHRKLSVLEQTIQKCIPSLVTMSQCISFMLENVQEMNKFDVNDFKKEKKEKQTKTVRHLGLDPWYDYTIFSLKQFDMSPIIESPSFSSEPTPKRPQRSSYRSSPHCKLNMEPYVRLKDVAAMLKNSKAVESPKRRLNESLGEGPSWLNTQENQIQCSNNYSSATIYVNNSPRLMTPNEVQADVPTIFSTSSSSMDNTFNETEVWRSDLISPIDSSTMSNITFRKRNKRSSETSNASEFNDSTSSLRPSRSASKKINYKENSLNGKLRR